MTRYDESGVAASGLLDTTTRDCVYDVDGDCGQLTQDPADFAVINTRFKNSRSGDINLMWMFRMTDSAYAAQKIRFEDVEIVPDIDSL